MMGMVQDREFYEIQSVVQSSRFLHSERDPMLEHDESIILFTTSDSHNDNPPPDDGSKSFIDTCGENWKK